MWWRLESLYRRRSIKYRWIDIKSRGLWKLHHKRDKIEIESNAEFDMIIQSESVPENWLQSFLIEVAVLPYVYRHFQFIAYNNVSVLKFTTSIDVPKLSLQWNLRSEVCFCHFSEFSHVILTLTCTFRRCSIPSSWTSSVYKIDVRTTSPRDTSNWVAKVVLHRHSGGRFW